MHMYMYIMYAYLLNTYIYMGRDVYNIQVHILGREYWYI